MAEPRPDLNIKVAAFTVTQKLYNTFYGLLTWPLYDRFDAHLNENVLIAFVSNNSFGNTCKIRRCQTVYVLSDLICVQTVCKDNQRTALAGEGESGILCSLHVVLGRFLSDSFSEFKKKGVFLWDG